MDHEKIKKVIETWVTQVILKHNICPYSHEVWEKGQFEIKVSENNGFTERMDELLDYLKKVNETLDRFGTALFVYPTSEENFIKFYNFNAMLDEELLASGLSESFQVVTFHPEFRFEGEKKSARGNFVNRSPFPILHILKSSDVAEIVERAGEDSGMDIALRNKKYLDNMSEEEFNREISNFISPFWKA